MPRTLILSVVLAIAIAVDVHAQLPDLPQPPPLPALPAPPPVPVPSSPQPPAIPAPQLPALPAPPAAPQLPPSGSQSPPSGSQSPSPPVRGPAAPSPAAGSSGGGNPGGGAGSGGGAGPAAPGRGPTAAAGGARGKPATGIEPGTPRRRSTRQDRTRREARLQSTVVALRGCLSALPARVRQVLVLRVGLGAGKPRSRRYVAEALEIRPRRVRRLERRGLARLRSLDERRSCAAAAVARPEWNGWQVFGPSAGVPSDVAVTTGVTGGDEIGARDGSGDGAAASGGDDAARLPGAIGAEGRVKGATAESPKPLGAVIEGGVDLVLLALAALAGLLGLAIYFGERRGPGRQPPAAP